MTYIVPAQLSRLWTQCKALAARPALTQLLAALGRHEKKNKQSNRNHKNPKEILQLRKILHNQANDKTNEVNESNKLRSQATTEYGEI